MSVKTYKLQTNDLLWWWEDGECNRVSSYFTNPSWAGIWMSEYKDNGYKDLK